MLRSISQRQRHLLTLASTGSEHSMKIISPHSVCQCLGSQPMLEYLAYMSPVRLCICFASARLTAGSHGDPRLSQPTQRPPRTGLWPRGLRLRRTRAPPRAAGGGGSCFHQLWRSQTMSCGRFRRGAPWRRGTGTDCCSGSCSAPRLLSSVMFTLVSSRQGSSRDDQRTWNKYISFNEVTNVHCAVCTLYTYHLNDQLISVMALSNSLSLLSLNNHVIMNHDTNYRYQILKLSGY